MRRATLAGATTCGEGDRIGPRRSPPTVRLPREAQQSSRTFRKHQALETLLASPDSGPSKTPRAAGPCATWRSDHPPDSSRPHTRRPGHELGRARRPPRQSAVAAANMACQSCVIRSHVVIGFQQHRQVDRRSSTGAYEARFPVSRCARESQASRLSRLAARGASDRR